MKSPYKGLNPYQVLQKKLERSHLANLKIYVSSDSAAIQELATDCGFIAIERPKELATNTARLVEVIYHAKNYLELAEDCQIIQISPVAPFVSIESLNEIYRLGQNKGSAAMSVTAFTGNAHPSLAGEITDGKFNFILDHNPRYPRQKRKAFFYPNGCLFSRCSSLIDGCRKSPQPTNPSMGSIQGLALWLEYRFHHQRVLSCQQT